MKLLLMLMLAAGHLLAQPATFTVTGPATAKPGATITLSLNLAHAGGASAPVAVQWGIALPGGSTSTVGGAPPNKTVSCTADQSFCLAYGVTAAAIAPGQLAAYTLRLPTAAAGSIAFPLSDLMAVRPDGTNYATAAGTAYTLLIRVPEDLTGDGQVTAADLQAMVAQVLAARSSPAACTDDQNADGRCDVFDVVRVLLKMLGQ